MGLRGALHPVPHTLNEESKPGSFFSRNQGQIFQRNSRLVKVFTKVCVLFYSVPAILRPSDELRAQAAAIQPARAALAGEGGTHTRGGGDERVSEMYS